MLEEYRYIAIEGNIGAGKSTLTSMLSEKFGGVSVHEAFADNPFLPEFYRDPGRNAFPLETYFLAERYNQLRQVFESPDLFRPNVFSDYLFNKSYIFAGNNLSEHELNLFRRLYFIMEASIPSPDIILYLHRPLETLRQNIIKRGRPYELGIEDAYLINLQKGYFSYFRQNVPAPVLVIELEDLDFVKDSSVFLKIIDLLNRRYDREMYVETLKNS